MTTDGEIIEITRDINVLLSLDTYQGMTDEEIQSIIDYCVKRERDKTINEINEGLIEDATIRYMQAKVAEAEHAASVLQSMLEIQIPWVTVGGDS